MLPRPVAEHIGCHPGTVYLGKEEYQHIIKEHGVVVTPEIMQHMPLALTQGKFFLDRDRPSCVSVFYVDRYTQRLYLMPLKACQKGGEVWVRTFYNISARKSQSKQKRYKLIYSGRPQT